MSVISAPELHKLIDAGVITAEHENVNAASIDIRLGDIIKVERELEVPMFGAVDEAKLAEFVVDAGSQALNFDEVQIPAEGLVIYPNQCFLAHSVEFFNLPDDISCEFKLRSSIARNFLQHMLAGWCDAGWNGAQLTLEFKNVSAYHGLRIHAGMRIGQMVFYRHESAGDKSYAKKGRYNGQTGVTESKGAK